MASGLNRPPAFGESSPGALCLGLRALVRAPAMVDGQFKIGCVIIERLISEWEHRKQDAGR